MADVVLLGVQNTTAETAGASGSTSAAPENADISTLPFNKDDVQTTSETPGPGRAMTQGSSARSVIVCFLIAASLAEAKDKIAADILQDTIAQRIAELKADPDVKEIGTGLVLCARCDTWVKLSNHMYAAHRWFGPNGHKAKTCRNKRT